MHTVNPGVSDFLTLRGQIAIFLMPRACFKKPMLCLTFLWAEIKLLRGGSCSWKIGPWICDFFDLNVAENLANAEVSFKHYFPNKKTASKCQILSIIFLTKNDIYQFLSIVFLTKISHPGISFWASFFLQKMAFRYQFLSIIFLIKNSDLSSIQ